MSLNAACHHHSAPRGSRTTLGVSHLSNVSLRCFSAPVAIILPITVSSRVFLKVQNTSLLRALKAGGRGGGERESSPGEGGVFCALDEPERGLTLAADRTGTCLCGIQWRDSRTGACCFAGCCYIVPLLQWKGGLFVACSFVLCKHRCFVPQVSWTEGKGGGCSLRALSQPIWSAAWFEELHSITASSGPCKD